MCEAFDAEKEGLQIPQSHAGDNKARSRLGDLWAFSFPVLF